VRGAWQARAGVGREWSWKASLLAPVDPLMGVISPGGRWVFARGVSRWAKILRLSETPATHGPVPAAPRTGCARRLATRTHAMTVTAVMVAPDRSPGSEGGLIGRHNLVLDTLAASAHQDPLESII
jgi:hypothetical protein